MAGEPPAVLAGAPGDPAGSQRGGRVPGWMLNKDDLGQPMVLVLRCKVPDGVTDDPQLPEPFVIGLSVESAIGIKEARSVKATREGRGSRYLLRTTSRSIVNKLTQLTELSDGTEIEIFPHPTLNTVQGIVYEPDSINTDEQVIHKHLISQEVQAVRRIKKRVNGKLQNTPLLILAFHGTTLPDHVFFGLLRIPVRTYYPSPLLCYNCGSYGHPRKACQKPGICLRCSQPLHLAEGEQCNNTPHCYHCEKEHPISSRDCAKFKEEDKIIHIKVDQNISFGEARRLFNEENRRETIARTIQNQLKQELAVKDKLIATLQKQVADLTKKLAALTPTPRESLRPSSQPSPFMDNQTTSSNPVPNIPHKTTHQSRKDKTFVSPPAKRKDNRDIGTDVGARTRSRSGKRIFEISPTSSSANRGKRVQNLPGTSSSATTVDNGS